MNWEQVRKLFLELSTPHGALGTTKMVCNSSTSPPLSTPHGALGTLMDDMPVLVWIWTFNSTRCIRNKRHLFSHNRPTTPFNSTRCIRNPQKADKHKCVALLSTPHGALGTSMKATPPVFDASFNSTRCIRN